MPHLPIESVLPNLRRVLADGRHALLTAPPGAGKTTAVPLALLDQAWLAGSRLVMLEPRRLAARAAAHRMAAMLGERVGETVGYRIRHDTNVGTRTRIEVVTEGILTRLLQHDPSLPGYGLVVFDEFHERSLHADLGLALTLEAHKLFRPDLRILVMSATLDCAAVSNLLGAAPVISCEGRSYPVETRYLTTPTDEPPSRIDRLVVQTVRRALAETTGSLLVFLPGLAEIRRAERQLAGMPLGPDVLVAPLHGDFDQEMQDRAIAPAPPGTRKVVLATSIAETSLTIEGVRVVIDAGLMRVARFDPRSGLNRLDTVGVTADSADQRRGRAGRLESGVCYRLWTAAQQATLAPRRPPDILDADLAPLMLELALWGAADPAELSWLDLPPAGAVSQARDLLGRLGALDRDGRITAHGKRMASLGLHPRLAHMILAALPQRLGALACDVAALLAERDLLRWEKGRHDADLRLRLDLLHGRSDHVGGATIDRPARARALRAAQHWRAQLKLPPHEGGTDGLGTLLAHAYPDRIAQRQPGREARYLLANGRGASFPEPEPLAQAPYLVIADLDGTGHWSRIFLAAPIDIEAIETAQAEQLRDVDSVTWDEQAQAVRARRQRRLGGLVLNDRAIPRPDAAMIAAGLLHGIRHAGLGCLPWTDELRQWCARVRFVRRVAKTADDWPDVSDAALLDRLEEWLGPSLDGLTTLAQVRRLDLTEPLQHLLTWRQRHELDRLAPAHLTVPSGSHIRLDYVSSDVPVLAVRLQELFGCRETPRIAGGTLPVTVHLLSPAGRPVQVTTDLASFWASAYHEVRKDLRGRYPKHHWPEDPLAAQPTRRTKAAMDRDR